MAYRHPIDIRFSDMDVLGHVNNAVYSTYFEEARLNMMKSIGLMRDPAKGKLGWILARSELDFRAIALWGQALLAEVTLEAIGNSSFTLRLKITRMADGALIAEGRSVQVCLDYSSHSPTRIPDDWRAKLSAI